MRGAGVVIAAVVGDAGRVSVVARVVSGLASGVSVHGEWLRDVAPPVRPLHGVGKVDVGGSGVDWLPCLGHHGVGDDDLLAGYESVVGRRVKIQVWPLVDECFLWELLHGAHLRVTGGVTRLHLSNRCHARGLGLGLQHHVVHWLELTDLVRINLIKCGSLGLHRVHGVHGVHVFL